MYNPDVGAIRESSLELNVHFLRDRNMNMAGQWGSTRMYRLVRSVSSQRSIIPTSVNYTALALASNPEFPAKSSPEAWSLSMPTSLPSMTPLPCMRWSRLTLGPLNQWRAETNHQMMTAVCVKRVSLGVLCFGKTVGNVPWVHRIPHRSSSSSRPSDRPLCRPGA